MSAGSARDVSKVARGEQAPRPSHEPGTISQAPPQTPTGPCIEVDEMKTAPADTRFPCTNQTRHCYTRCIEYHRCVKVKGENALECENLQDIIGHCVLVNGLIDGMNRGNWESSPVQSRKKQTLSPKLFF